MENGITGISRQFYLCLSTCRAGTSGTYADGWVFLSRIVSLSRGKETDMSKFMPRECHYHDDGDGFMGGGDCPNEGRIKTARYRWLCFQ
jgi:hypothetical protein